MRLRVSLGILACAGAGSWTCWAAPPAVWQTPHVIVIGVDGLSVDAVRTAATPNIHEMMARGAWTLTARGVMPTLSSPNWESIIGGAPPEQHGITSNGHLRHLVEFAPACQDDSGKFPTIFGILRAERPSSRIAVFNDWRGFAELVEPHAPDVMQHERGADRTVTAAMEYWNRERPALLFMHLDNVDQAGHEVGWKAKAYYRAVEKADFEIGRVLKILDRAAARATTFVLVTSDHGGTKHGHGKNSLAEILIPWILEGPDVVPGQVQLPVNTYDTAVTLAWIYNLEVPACWTGRPVLAAFQPALVSARQDAAGRAGGAVCVTPAQRAGMTLVPTADPVDPPAGGGATGQH